MSKYILAFINLFMLIIVIILSSVAIPTFNYNFYRYEYRKNNTYEIIGVSEVDLKNVTHKMISYLKLKTDNLNVNAFVNGESREFFNEKEKLHMEDVQYLFAIGINARIVAAILFLISFLLGFYYKDKNTVYTYLNFWRFGLASFILFCFLGALFILSDFDKNFIIFHEIFFQNDLWMLDYSTDLLINIVPLNFFIDIFKAVAIVFCVMSAAIIILSTVLLRLRPNNKKIEA